MLLLPSRSLVERKLYLPIYIPVRGILLHYFLAGGKNSQGFGSGEQGSAGIGSVVDVIHQAADGSAGGLAMSYILVAVASVSKRCFAIRPV